MSSFRGIISCIFSLVAIFVMALYLIRLGNGQSAYIGFDDLLFYFSKLDWIKPLTEFYTKCLSLINGFEVVGEKFMSINNIGDFFVAIGSFFSSVFDLLTFPVQLIYYIGYFLINIFTNIFTFLGYACGLVV